MEDLRKAFIEWLHSDNVVKTIHGYKCQCMQYSRTFSLFGIYRYFIREYGSFYL